jgi:hypothetical protein
MRFRIYYEDGSTYEGDGFADAIMAPTMRVQVIVNDRPSGAKSYSMQHSKDAYCWRDDGGWYAVDSLGLHEYLFEAGKAKYMVFGGTMARTAEFHACLNRALDEGLGDDA